MGFVLGASTLGADPLGAAGPVVCRLDAQPLSDNGWWSDEGLWSALTQSVEFAIPGVPIFDQYEYLSGQPITVANLLLDRPTVEALWVMRDAPKTYRTLILPDARSFGVLFNFDGQPVEAVPVKNRPDPATSLYLTTLRFIEASP